MEIIRRIGRSMPVSVMPSKAMWRSLFWGLCILCLPCAVGATSTAPGDKPGKVLYELNPKKERMDQEREAFRWTDIFVSDLALYSVDGFSIHEDTSDGHIMVMKVRALYGDKVMLSRLQEKYRSKLKEGRVAIAMEMEIHFHMQEEMYAITEVILHDQEHEVVDRAVRPAVYQKIPYNSFVYAAYRMGSRYLEFKRVFGEGKKSVPRDKAGNQNVKKESVEK